MEEEAAPAHIAVAAANHQVEEVAAHIAVVGSHQVVEAAAVYNAVAVANPQVVVAASSTFWSGQRQRETGHYGPY